MKLWAMTCRATQDRRVIDLLKRGPLEEGMANHSSVLARRTPWTIKKGKKILHRKMSPPKDRCPICYCGKAITNSSRKNEAARPKWKRCSVVDMSSGESKIRCCKEKYCIGTWNVRSMNQGKLEVVKQEMERANIDVWGISELKWTGVHFYANLI